MPDAVQGGLGLAEGARKGEETWAQITTFESNCDEPTQVDVREDLGRASRTGWARSCQEGAWAKAQGGKARMERREGQGVQLDRTLICRMDEDEQ